jgi:hypothetical protein
MSLKALLEKLPATPVGSVDAPELGPGIKVHVRRFNLADRQAFTEAARSRKVSGPAIGLDTDEPIRDRYRRLLALCVCDEHGQPEFTAEDPSIDLIPGILADRLIDAAMNLNREVADSAKKPSPTPR